ncbi:MAG: GNAT family N-acetyltransferase [Burkholderiaceae bacterium]|nr:GNAT family N-acetyltransferase [Burkholderiaceae bacterium]
MNKSPLTLRSARPSDAAAVASFMAEPEVFAGLLQLPYPTPEGWADRVAGFPAASNNLHLVAELDGNVVASAGVFAVGNHVRRRHASALGISVAKEAQGKGVGTALMAALLDYADRWGQILRIELNVFTDNDRAIGLYERFGFVREGLLRKYALRDGQYVDSLMMARLHPNPPQWTKG